MQYALYVALSALSIFISTTMTPPVFLQLPSLLTAPPPPEPQWTKSPTGRVKAPSGP